MSLSQIYVQEEEPVPEVKKEILPAIFSNIKAIHSLHKKLLKELDLAYVGIVPSIENIVKIMKDYVPQFFIYLRYGDSYNNAATLLLLYYKNLHNANI